MLWLGTFNGLCMVMEFSNFTKKPVGGAIILNRQNVPRLVIKSYYETRAVWVAYDVIANLIYFGGKL